MCQRPVHILSVIYCSHCRALGADDRRAELQYWRRLLRYSCAFTLPVFMLAMVLPMMPGCEALFKTHLLGFPLDELLKWALATPVQFWVGWRFHAGAWKALRNGRWAHAFVLPTYRTTPPPPQPPGGQGRCPNA